MLAPIWFGKGVAWDITHVHINNMSITPTTTNDTKINGVNNGTRNSTNGKRKTEIGPVLFNGTVGTSSTKPESRQNLCRIPAEPQFGRFLARISAEPVHHPHFSGLKMGWKSFIKRIIKSFIKRIYQTNFIKRILSSPSTLGSNRWVLYHNVIKELYQYFYQNFII